MCLYTSSRVAASVSMFRAYNNSAFTVLFTRSKVAILESPIFHLNTPARLHFDYFVSKGPAKLHFCQDSVMRDLSSCFIISAEGETFGWKHDFIEVFLFYSSSFYGNTPSASSTLNAIIALSKILNFGRHSMVQGNSTS